jgi:hypothetical protein
MSDPDYPDEPVEEDVRVDEDERQPSKPKVDTTVSVETISEFYKRRGDGKISPEAKKMAGLTALKCPHLKPDELVCRLALDEEYCKSLKTTTRHQPCTGGRYEGCEHYKRRLVKVGAG